MNDKLVRSSRLGAIGGICAVLISFLLINVYVEQTGGIVACLLLHGASRAWHLAVPLAWCGGFTFLSFGLLPVTRVRLYVASAGLTAVIASWLIFVRASDDIARTLAWSMPFAAAVAYNAARIYLAASAVRSTCWQFSIADALLVFACVGSFLGTYALDVPFITERESGTRVFLKSTASGQTRIVFRGGPQRLKGLISAPDARESELNEGTWIVLVFAVWSMSDCECILEAVRFASDSMDAISVGVRPCVDPSEITSWCPEYGVEQSGYLTPQWVLLHDGVLIGTYHGILTAPEIAEFKKQALPGRVPAISSSRTRFSSKQQFKAPE